MNLGASGSSQFHSMDSSDNQMVEDFHDVRFADARTPKYAAAMSNYVPTPVAVRAICFSIDFDARAWRQMSPDLEIIKSPGTHYQPDFAFISHLRARLQGEVAGWGEE